MRKQNAIVKRNKFSFFQTYWKGLLFASLILTVSFILFHSITNWMKDQDRLPLSKIIVQGTLNYLTPLQIRDAVVGLGQLNSFMLQDVDIIHHSISDLPWVANVAVRKQWPDTLKVNVTEHKPLAIWNLEQMLDVNGVVFAGNFSDISHLNLVSLQGPEGSEKEMLTAWQEIQEVLAQRRLKVQELVLNERRSWRVTTTEGIRIELGRTAKIERVNRFIDLFDNIMQSNQVIKYVDLRYDIGAAVGWDRQEPSLENKPKT